MQYTCRLKIDHLRSRAEWSETKCHSTEAKRVELPRCRGRSDEISFKQNHIWNYSTGAEIQRSPMCSNKRRPTSPNFPKQRCSSGVLITLTSLRQKSLRYVSSQINNRHSPHRSSC